MLSERLWRPLVVWNTLQCVSNFRLCSLISLFLTCFYFIVYIQLQCNWQNMYNTALAIKIASSADMALHFLLPTYLPTYLSVFTPGQQRASGLQTKWIFHIFGLHAGGGPATGAAPFLGYPTVASFIMAADGEVPKSRWRDHGKTNYTALHCTPSHWHHTCGPWVVSPCQSAPFTAPQFSFQKSDIL